MNTANVRLSIEPAVPHPAGNAGSWQPEGPSARIETHDSPRPALAHVTPGVVQQPGVLSKHNFITQLQIEKRRTDRSKIPFSVVLVRAQGASSGGLSSQRKLVRALLIGKRETDLLGYLADDFVALLLPNTDSDGARAVARKVNGAKEVLPITVSTATYPDDLLDGLMDVAAGPDSHPFLLDSAVDRSRLARGIKKATDIVGAMALILLTSPVMLLVSLAIVATSPGPVLFRQLRLGRGGVPFVFLKFRSMHANADDAIHREYVARLIEGKNDAVNQGAASDPYYKIKSDPRVSAVGRFIRATSIDELPQLFNVLKGEMSLVGPRPPIPYEAEKYESWHLRRVMEIQPGITGLWQVEGRSKTSFDEMVRLDLRYIKNWSLALDLVILLKTVRVVLRRDGAS